MGDMQRLYKTFVSTSISYFCI